MNIAGRGQYTVFEIHSRCIQNTLLSLLVAALLGCAQTSGFHTAGGFTPTTPTAQVLLIPPDIELYEITAGGLAEPKANWTKAASGHVFDALNQFLRQREDTLVVYRPPSNDPENMRAYEQLLKLHAAVGQTILIHKYNSLYSLPTKAETFDWSLGDSVDPLYESYNAEYALFIFLRDSYASGERIAVIVAAALLGAGVSGGNQVGFATLVDLSSGDIVWFNLLFRQAGDLRTPAAAQEAVTQLLKGIPL
jgi:hypothetical protein